MKNMLDRQLKFSEHIIATFFRLDMALISSCSKQVLLVEMTVPWEDCIEEANKRNWSKYQEWVERLLEFWLESSL